MKGLLLLLVLLEGFSLTSSIELGVMYYVKPDQSTKCPGQPCETLSYYLDNVNSTVNQHKNVTMVFLNGEHTVNVSIAIATITTPVITMVGESKNQVVLGKRYFPTFVVFYNNTEVCLKNLVMISCIVEGYSDKLEPTKFQMLSVKLLSLCMFQIEFNLDTDSQAFIEHVTVLEGGELALPIHSVLNACKFQDFSILIPVGSTFEINDSIFINAPINVQGSNINVSGDTLFSTSYQESALTVYLSTITLSGNVTFADNTGIRGGAMALYSSTLIIAPGTITTFTNNSAQHKGGAIYIEPGIVPSVVCLLYTSPSPRDATLSRMPSSA